MAPRPDAVILAGGRGRRMGGADKALILLAGRPLLSHVLDRMAPQAGRIALSANGAPARFAAFGLPVLPDAGADLGPMAGLLAGLDWAAALGDATHLLTLSVDTPFLPADLASRLASAAGQTGLALAESRGRLHPTCGLWPLHLRAPLARALATGERRIGDWALAQGAVSVAFDGDPDPFLNLNRPEDTALAERLLPEA